MYTLYTDDSILTGSDPGEIDHILEHMRKAKLNIREE